METKSKSLLLIAGIAALSLGAVAFAAGAFSNKNLGNISKVSGTDSKSIILTTDDFNKTVLEDFTVPDNRGATPTNRNDKKFKIELEDGKDGKYILGAIIYHDCGLQYIGTSEETDATLGDAFTIDNTEDKSNAFNFHIAFALDNVESISYTYTASVTSYPGAGDTRCNFYSAVKTRQYSNDGTDESFYNELTTRGYLGVIDDIVPIEEEEEYDPFYFDIWESDGYSVYANGESNQQTFGFENIDKNMVFIQINNSSVMLGKKLKATFTLDSITFNYHCN